MPEIYQKALRIDEGEPCDLIVNNFAIDTKYRVGSGDSGTLKKFKHYGPLLQEKGYVPVMLFLRSDNLESAITVFKKGNWLVYTADETFDFIKNITNVDLYTILQSYKGQYSIC